MHDKIAGLGEFFDARTGTPKPKKGTATDAKKVPKGHQKKWLTPFGVRIIDEAHRAPTPELPHQLLEDFYQLECEDGPEYCASLSSAEMRALVDNTELKLQRVFIYGIGKDGDFIDCDIFENLHKHPCEEIHVRRASCSKKAIGYLAKCTSLKVINFFDCSIDKNSVQTLISKLPKLQVFHTDDLLTLEMSQKIAKPKTFTYFTEYKGKDLKRYLDYINKNKETIECVEIGRCVKPMLDALATCPNLKSFQYNDRDGSNCKDSNKFLLPFLSNAQVRKRLEHVDMRDCLGHVPSFKLLGQFSNIKWLNLSSTMISVDSLNKIIEKNADHIIAVDVGKCPMLKEDVLEAVAKCKNLKRIDLRMTKVTKVAVNRYKSEKKPSYSAILHKMYGDVRHPYHAGNRRYWY